MTNPQKQNLSDEQARLKLQGFANEFKALAEEYDVACLLVFAIPFDTKNNNTAHGHQIDTACRVVCCQGETLGLVAEASKMISNLIDQQLKHE